LPRERKRKAEPPAAERATDAPAAVLSEETRAALDAVPDPCLVVDREGTVALANASAADQLGRVNVGDPLSFTLRVPTFLDAVDRVLHNGEAEDITWLEKVPTERWYEAFIRPLRVGPDVPPPFAPAAGAEAPAPPALVAIFLRDLTEQKRIERMRADFVANASHELRTPLASLTGFIETLRGAARDDAKARETFLGIMHDQAARMRRLIDDLLSLSRVEMRAHVRPRAVIDLAEVTRNAVDGLRPLAEEEGVALDLEGCEVRAPVVGDRDELVQVLDNLITNALKYGRAPGARAGSDARVLVSLAIDPEATGTACVTVRDFGPGIPPEHLPRLTERFYRIESDSMPRERGTGLGLAIVKHILTRHQGRLSVESTLGRGSAFTIRLALVPAAGEVSGASGKAHENQGLTLS
jgi:two-component system phosphate regulon sensor histidine kinase PhoR